MSKRLDDMLSLGTGWIRFDIDWSSVEYTKGVFDWSEIDRLVNYANQRNIKILAILDNTPEWAREPGCFSDKCAPANLQDFADFAKKVVQRYSVKGLHDWEIWNEPNTIAFWKPVPDVKKYTELIKLVYVSIKSADSSANVMVGSMAPAATSADNISPIDFLSGIYSNSGRDYFNSVSFHPYSFPVIPSYNAPWNAWQQMSNTKTSLRSIMLENGDSSKKIWITEFGAPTGGPGGIADIGNYNFSVNPDHVTEDLQSKIFEDAWSLVSSYTWSGPLFWYSYKDLGITMDTIENFFGIIRYDGTLKPVYNTIKNILQSGQ
jgi:hypothetical protein